MRPLDRRTVLAAAAACAVGGLLARAAAQGAPREIEVVARRFSFTPAEIVLKAGERAVLLVRSLDFVHGLNIPDLGLRADLVPGRVTRVELPPLPAGEVPFLCDNFCGDGHEGMHGRLVVRA